MRLRHRIVALGVLFTFCCIAQPARARQTLPEETPAKRLQRMEAEHDLARREAMDWAAVHGIPTRLRLADGRTVELVRLERGHPVYLATHNAEAAGETHTDQLYPGGTLGLNLTGAGMEIGIWDAGQPRTTHHEFAGRVTLLNHEPADNHATHVAGTMAATGVRPEARGMAYQAQIRAYDWTNDLTEMQNEAARGLSISNHSYGPLAGWEYGDFEDTGTDGWYWFGDSQISTEEDYLFGWYDKAALEYDMVTSAYPYLLPVVSAGNDRSDRGPTGGTYRIQDSNGRWQTASVATSPIPRDGQNAGFDSIAGQANAKNVLTVGSIGSNSLGTKRLSAFSSLGPTDDGRIKPDLVGFGEAVFSALGSSDNAYGFLSGTSMATANISGSLLLLQEHYFNLRGKYLRAATLKGLALHTAIDLGLPGPDFQYGWGLLDAREAAVHLAYALSNPVGVFEGSLANDDAFSRTATVDIEGPFRVTLSWTDLPSVFRLPTGPGSLDDPLPHLVHDLDLRLINDETGDIYLPFTLDPRSPATQAQRGDNARDPVEQIYLPGAPPGAYTIVVSHKGNLRNTQPFSLLVTGAADAFRPVAVGHLRAEALAGVVDLNWQTPSEQGSGSFIIERAPLTTIPGQPSQPGPPVQLGAVPTHGAPGAAATYSFRDPSAGSGWNRYRIYFEGDNVQYLADEIDVRVPVPEAFTVVSNYPNPFTDATELVFDLMEDSHVRVDVYDALGRHVARVADEVLTAGRRAVRIEADGWVPGLYVARVSTGDAQSSHKMMLIR